jgi:hypothetical protein
MRRLPGVCAVVILLLVAGCQAPAHGPSLPERPDDDPGMSQTPAPDPSEDVIGWENGVWHDDPLPVDASDGLNGSELGLVVNRSMARVEYLRRVEFDRVVPVEVITRAEFADQVEGGGSGDVNRSRAQFRNTKFEALFLVGEGTNADQRRRNNTKNTVLGYYAPAKDRITIISETETPTVTERTLAHELVHAYQWGRYDMSRLFGPTMEERNAGRAVFEGVARYLDRRYDDRCGGEWACVSPPPDPNGSDGGGGGDVHRGLALLQYFPYSDGPVLVDHQRRKGGWDAVADLYTDPPESTEQVIDPELYRIDPPSDVTVRNRSNEAWTRVRPPGNGPGFESVGQPGLTAMFAYPAYDDRGPRPVIPRSAFQNLEDGALDRSDPFTYDVPPADGWDGDKMYVYANESGATGYVWRLAWDTGADAREFADAYRRLLRYWGGEPRGGVWHIPESESQFGDTFAFRVDGSTVTIVNGPGVGDLEGIHAPVRTWGPG